MCSFLFKIQDYLTSDFTESDSFLNDIFSDFDINTNDIHHFDSPVNSISYFQSSQDLPSSCKVTMKSMATDTNVTKLELEFDDVLSPDAFKLFFEQDQSQQQATTESIFSPLNSISTNHDEVTYRENQIIICLFFNLLVFINICV